MDAMFLDSVSAILAAAAPGAPGAPTTQPNPTADLLRMIGPLLLMGFIFYFLIIRPQSKKAKEHAELLKTLKPGDKVLTNGGVVGIVVAVKEKTVSVRSIDTKFEILKTAVVEVTERGTGAEVSQA
jgi:preprotein translocase subunit YajC